MSLLTAHRVLLARIYPLHVPSGRREPQYIASEFFATGPRDDMPNIQYTGALRDDAFFSRSIVAGDRIGGRTIPDFGQVTVINAAEPITGRRFDAWLDPAQYVFQSAPIELDLVLDGDYAQRLEVARGLVADLDYQVSTISLLLKGNALPLDRPHQPHRYAGTGGDEGDAAVAGRPKPRALGHLANVPPVVVNSATYLTQVNDGDTEAVDAVRDRGAPYTPPADYALLLASGQIDIVAQPAGQVTADVRGSTLSGTYSARPADILPFLAAEQGLASDAAAMAALALAAPYDIGHYAPDEMSTAEVCDAIVASFGGWHGTNRAGQFDAGIFGEPGAPSLAIDAEDIELGTLERSPLGRVVWRVVLNYRPNWLVQSPDQLVPEPTLSQADRTRYGRQYQGAVAVEDAAIKAAYPDASELVIDSLIHEDADALAEAQRQFAYWSRPRSLYGMWVRNLAPLSADLNDTVLLTFPAMQLSGGKAATVVEIIEYYLQGRVKLTLAG